MSISMSLVFAIYVLYMKLRIRMIDLPLKGIIEHRGSSLEHDVEKETVAQ